VRSGDHRAAVLAAAIACIAAAAPASAASPAVHGRLTSAQHAFAVAYEKLVPSLNKANANVITVVDHAGNKSAAQIGTEFAALAKRWDAAIKPLLSLRVPPAPEATPFLALVKDAVHIGTDLKGIGAGGAANNTAEAKRATTNLVHDNHALAMEGTALQKLLTR
jgi:hypothetical protein